MASVDQGSRGLPKQFQCRGEGARVVIFKIKGEEMVKNGGSMYGLFVADPWLRKGTENLSCVWRWQLSSCKEDLCFPFFGKEKKNDLETEKFLQREKDWCLEIKKKKK